MRSSSLALFSATQRRNILMESVAEILDRTDAEQAQRFTSFVPFPGETKDDLLEQETGVVQHTPLTPNEIACSAN